MARKKGLLSGLADTAETIGLMAKYTVARGRKMQTGKTTKSRDKKLLAKHPGKRKSASGRVYWETRKNRSDASRRLRL